VLRTGDDFPTSCQNVDCSTQRPNAFIKHARKPNMRERELSGNPTFSPRAKDQGLEHLQEAVQVQVVKKIVTPISRISRKFANIKGSDSPLGAERLCKQSLQLGTLRRDRRNRRQMPNSGIQVIS